MVSMRHLRGTVTDQEYREEKNKREQMQKHGCYKCEFANWINSEKATCSYGVGCFKNSGK